MTTKIENWFEKHLNNRFLNPDNITVISFSKSIQQIENFESLPDNVKEAIKTADHIESVVAVEFDDHVAIRFVDDGDGMSPDTISCLGLSIASKTSTGEGTGIIKRLVNQGGAAVEWSSAGIGAGSCVTIRLQKQAQMEVAS